ncbi:MAG: CoA-binding protein [Pseudomonadota bacterium]
MDTAERILREYDTIAVVGMSQDPNKAAHAVPRVLRAAGFRVVPVNPHATEILGERAYPRLEDVPVPVDLVLVFRPSREAEGIARSAVAIGAKALWLQLGIRSDAARRIAEEAGLRYVEDHCAAVERAIHDIRKN